MRLAVLSFGGWLLSFITEINSILQAVVLLVSLLAGLLSVIRQFKEKKK